ncbi:virulence plasmid 65kDa B protein-domain-containing protein [Aspergillus carlsbadensis]|nr:virulence plasmid 65kDa B protein-domain-containing protein [Aspergillus carlsbadensis]
MDPLQQPRPTVPTGTGQTTGLPNGETTSTSTLSTNADTKSSSTPWPTLSLPQGGGSAKGMGEKLKVNPSTGTVSLSVPIKTSDGRGGMDPSLSLSYDSGSGNGPFGLGWSLSPATISRKTDRGLPVYHDFEDSDVFILSGSEDLVPVLNERTDEVLDSPDPVVQEYRDEYTIRRYMPRVESAFLRIERWTHEDGGSHWRTITPDNVTSVFGRSSDSQIFDPEQPKRVFSWLISETYDTRGNAIVYRYKRENSDGVDVNATHEVSRSSVHRTANSYIKEIKYGNRTPNRDLESWQAHSASALPDSDWMFSVVFDYGEYDNRNPSSLESNPWACRPDAFSHRRAGFEIRTYRVCQRVLMFHHFPEELGRPEYLVGATELKYDEGFSMTFLKSVQYFGYLVDDKSGKYRRASLPPLEFHYTESPITGGMGSLRRIPVPIESGRNLPEGVDGSTYRWIDLDGEGLPGVLAREAECWYYMRNRSANNEGSPTTSGGDMESIIKPKFEAAELIRHHPALGGNHEGVFFSDVQGDGFLDLVKTDDAFWSFSKRWAAVGNDPEWSSFRSFVSFPNIHIDDPNTRFIDLTGDGLADILITGDQAFTWYQSEGEKGYSGSQRVARAINETQGPHIIFADVEQSVYLADMTGDGLNDIVRIRQSQVCYWPNLGYGRFGRQVCMGNSPRFDRRDRFNQDQVRLADVDGSGYTDILYLRPDGIDLYRNLAGNRLDSAISLVASLPTDHLATIDAVDLLGNGTICLVWSSSLPDRRRGPMKYINLTKGVKPHLLQLVTNNLGAETEFEYAPSTKFYLDDVEKGNSWLTRLPFPVQCVHKMITIDRISGNVFTTRYAYHHGYYDGVDREFRGFGMVEEWDTDAYAVPDAGTCGDDQLWYTHPIHTKTWFHLGFLPEYCDYSELVASEYFDVSQVPGCRAQGMSSRPNNLLEKTVMPLDLTKPQLREAYRALKGQVLRTETYADDDSDQAAIPYTITETKYIVSALQKEGDGHGHRVCTVFPIEDVSVNAERELADNRIHHHLVLERDRWGNVLKEVKIAYGRHFAAGDLSERDQAIQQQTLITYHENRITDAILDRRDDYLLPRTSGNRLYELHGLHRPSEALFSSAAFSQEKINFLPDVPYECRTSCHSPSRRLLAESIVLYRSDDLTTILPQSEIGVLGLAGEGYQLALTQGILDTAFVRDSGTGQVENLLPSPALILEGSGPSSGGYVDLYNDGRWWIPTARPYFHPSPDASPAEELELAKQHFFFVRRQTDPFGQHSIAYFDPHNLIITKAVDAVGTVIESRIDYRLLRAYEIIDPNKNRTQCAFDELGFVVGTAMMGKEGELVGDSLADFQPYLSQDEVNAFFADPTGPFAAKLLGSASTRTIYDPNRYRNGLMDSQTDPVYEATISREEHANGSSDPATKRQVRINYYDGFDRVIQSKFQAEPDRKNKRPRWVGSGWTVYNNKGDPVRKYEPFFDSTHEFMAEHKQGVSPTIFYDPLSRVVAVLNPNHTYTKSIYKPWEHISYDVNNTILQRPDCDPDVEKYFQDLPESVYLPTWYESRINGSLGREEKAAAQKVAAHAETPCITHMDSLGRSFVTISDNGVYGNYSATVLLDIQGNQIQVTDALGRTVLRSHHDMLGNQLHNASIDSGERWTLKDITGRPIHVWDSRGGHLTTAYDILRRPISSILWPGTDRETVVEKIEYGDSLADPETRNCRDRIIRVFDQSGINTSDEYDFKGNPLSSSRQVAVDYKNTLDWSEHVPLEDEVHTNRTWYDALDRQVQVQTPDGSRVRYSYNEAGFLEAVTGTLSDDTGDSVFVKSIDYDAKGQREQIVYGNSARTIYTYDPATFSLKTVVCTRSSEGNSDYCRSDDRVVQHLEYTYDPIGNVTTIRDKAQQRVFFRNQVVEPTTEYTYDPIYRLIAATGREHVGQAHHPIQNGNVQDYCTRHYLPGDGNAMQRYTETFRYDNVGNFLEVKHQSSDTHASWTRKYQYNEPSQLDPRQVGNRLTCTTIGSVAETYRYDGEAGKHGNMTAMPLLQLMEWSYKDQLQATSRQRCNGDSREITYYTYDAKGARVRKVTEDSAGRKTKERIYLGEFQVLREYYQSSTANDPVKKEQQNIHIMDDATRVAIIETTTKGDIPKGAPRGVHRYQFSNHIGSVALELDQDAHLLSYEEFTPYGLSSFAAQSPQLETPKRYRYNGKERDEESGLYYYGARYYAPWISRWINADPGGITDGLNVFVYVRCNPVILSDPNGAESKWLNRGIGALQLIGGALEVTAGAAGMAAPTGVTQVLGAVAIVHGSDTVLTGLETLWTGEIQKTATEMIATEGAKAMGASDQTAERIGAVTDFVAGVGPSVAISLTKKATTTALIEGSTEIAEHSAPDVVTEVVSHAAPAAADEATTHAAPKVMAEATTSELATHAAPEALEKAVVEAAPEAVAETAAHAAPQVSTKVATETATEVAAKTTTKAAAKKGTTAAAKKSTKSAAKKTTTKAKTTKAKSPAKPAKPKQTAKAAKAARPPETDWHHVFAKEAELAAFFKRMGINIHKVGKYVPDKVHDVIHHPLAGKWERGWNDEWKYWIAEQTRNGNIENLTQRGVMRKMHQMMEQYGISQYMWSGRDWYRGVSTFLDP